MCFACNERHDAVVLIIRWHSAGRADCGNNTCPNLLFDKANCGACGRICEGDKICAATKFLNATTGQNYTAGACKCPTGRCCVKGNVEHTRAETSWLSQLQACICMSFLLG